MSVVAQADAVAVWKSSCRKRAHADVAATTPASASTAALALLSIQPEGMLAVAIAVPLLHQQQQQGLDRPLLTPDESPVAPQLADHGQLQQQPKQPSGHAQVNGQGAQQAQQVPLAVQAKQAQQAQHACPEKPAQNAVQGKQDQHLPQPAQRTQHALPAQQAQHALLAEPAVQGQRAVQAVTSTQHSGQATQQAKQPLPDPPSVLPQLVHKPQHVQHAVQIPSSMVSVPSEQLTLKRPAPSADNHSTVKRHKVCMRCCSTYLFVHAFSLHSTPSSHAKFAWCSPPGEYACDHSRPAVIVQTQSLLLDTILR